MLQSITKGLACLLLLLTCFTSFAQQRTVTGSVVDPQTSEPLQKVTVSIKGSNKNTFTDDKGEFSIVVSGNETVLRFTYAGYTYQELAVGAKTALSISMSKDNKQLDDVVVVGYGQKKRANVLGSVATLNPKEIEDLPVANLTTALKNTIPGLSISQTSGKPGSSTSINIRGATTFATGANTEPLFVIDGITYDGNTNQVSNGKTAFDNLDATQIESITFLKDAAASIYGARGANGVVLVTTKKGKPGKPSISYSSSYGLSDASKMPEMLTAFEHATLLNNKYKSRSMDILTPDAIYTPEELAYLKTHDYNWVNDTWKSSHLMRHTINVSGGSDKITFFGGANYYKEDGNLSDLYATRYGLRFGSKAKITDNLSTSVTVSTDNAVQNRPTPKGTTITDQGDQLNGTMSALLITPRWIPMYNEGLPVFSAVPGWHPLELQNSGTYAKSSNTGINLNASLDYRVPVIKGLSFNVNYGLNRRMSNGKEYYVKYPLYNFVKQGAKDKSFAGRGGSFTVPNVIFTPNLTASPITYHTNGDNLQLSSAFSNNYQLNESVTYARKFGKHDFNLLLLAEQAESHDETVKTVANVQVISGKDELWAFSSDKSNYDHSSSTGESGRASYLGRLNYSFMDRYLVEAVLRADASPNFPPQSRWGYFPSVAVGWKLSEEKFIMEKLSFIDELKLRIQVGLTGNDAVTPYQYYERFSQTTGMLFGTAQTNGLNNNVVPNESITWEKALFKNFGLDGTLLNHRLTFALDYYYKHTTDMLEPSTATVPTTFGGNISNQNHGILNNWGYEASIGYNGTINKDLSFFVSTNFSKTDNKVIDKYYNLQSDTGYLNPIGKRTDRGITGYFATGIMHTQEEVTAWYKDHPGWLIGSDSLRLGAMNFRDIDGDGKISANDQTQIIGRSGSKFGVGFNLGGDWKGLRLSANISLSVGGYRTYDATARASVSETAGALSFWRDSWSPENPYAKYPVAGSTNLNQTSTFWVVDNTSMRVNNMQLSYSLPSSLKTRYKLPQVRFYVVGTNLWNLINKQDYKDLGNNVAVDYPILRTYTFGANVNF